MINLLGLFPHIKRNKPFLNEVVHIFNATTFNMVFGELDGVQIVGRSNIKLTFYR